MSLAFVVLDDLANELESCEHVEHFDSVGAADARCHLGGNDALDGIGLIGHGACFLVCRDDIIEQERAHLVTCDGSEGAVLGSRHDTHAVGIGVGRHDQVGANLVCQLDSQFKYLGVFGIGLCDGGEVSADDHLLVNGVKMLQSDPTQDFGHEAVSRSVNGGVNDLEVVCHVADCAGVDRLRLNCPEILLVDLFADQLDLTLVECCLIVHFANIRKNVQLVDFGGNRCSMLGGKLCAVLPVYLVAVVLLGIVRCRDVDARNALQLSERKGQFGRGAKRVKEIDLDAVCGKDRGRGLGKQFGIVSRVVCNCNTVRGSSFLQNQCRQTLGCVCNGVTVHGVQSNLHDAAQSGGAKGEATREANLFLVLILGDGAQLLLFDLAKLLAREPFFINSLII